MAHKHILLGGGITDLFSTKSLNKTVCSLIFNCPGANDKTVNYLCPGEDVRRYISGPAGASEHGQRFDTQEVAERVLRLMNGSSYRSINEVINYQ